jgi:inorganic pyrophosphatase
LISVSKLQAGKNPPDDINVVIEIPKGGNIKYEIDAESNTIFVDRKLSATMVYPSNYGFIPQTEEKDGDPTDVLVLGDDPLVPMSIIRSHPVGVLLTEDEKGQDSKIIAVPIAKIDPNFATFKDIENIPEHMRNQIKYFFEHYKELEEGKYVKVMGMENNEVAKKKISEAIERYKQNINKR